jgi:hypothetical protein
LQALTKRTLFSGREAFEERAEECVRRVQVRSRGRQGDGGGDGGSVAGGHQ